MTFAVKERSILVGTARHTVRIFRLSACDTSFRQPHRIQCCRRFTKTDRSALAWTKAPAGVYRSPPPATPDHRTSHPPSMARTDPVDHPPALALRFNPRHMHGENAGVPTTARTPEPVRRSPRRLRPTRDAVPRRARDSRRRGRSPPDRPPPPPAAAPFSRWGPHPS